jgi:hypothetical protein
MKSRLFCLAIFIATAFVPSTASAWHHHAYNWSEQWGYNGNYGNSYGWNRWMGPSTIYYPPMMFYPPVTYYPYLPWQPVAPAPAPVQPAPAPASVPAPPPIPASKCGIVPTVTYCEKGDAGAESCREVNLDPASIPEDSRLMVKVAKVLDIQYGYQITVKFNRISDGAIRVDINVKPFVECSCDEATYIGYGKTTMGALRSFLPKDP